MSSPRLETRNTMLVAAMILGASLAGCGAAGNSSSLPVNSQPALSVPIASSTSLASESPISVSRVKSKLLAGRRTAGNAIGYSSTVLADQPLAYYPLSDTVSTLSDTGPNNIAGLYGADIVHQAAAITLGGSSAATFPGGSTYDGNGFAYTPPNGALQPAQITMEAWLKLSASNTTNHDIPIVVYGTDVKGVIYGLYIHGLSSTQSSILYTQRSSSQPSPLFLYGITRLSIGKVYHVVAVSDGTNVTTYINGLQDKSISYPGSISYGNSVVHGLSIGGQYAANPTYGSAPFNGTIAQVAVYGSALTPTSIVNHFLAGQLVPMTTETAAQSDALVDSIGVNAHFENHYTSYVTQYPQVKSLLLNVGIRHIRTGMLFGDQNYYSMMKDLASSGIHGSFTTQLAFTQSQITQFPSLVSPSLEQYEAPNEQDDQGNPNWVGPCRAFQQSLYSWVKADPQTSRYPVLGPALATTGAFQALGDISAYMDKGNMHDYFSFFNPGTLGWGSISQYGTYGSLSTNMNMVRVTSSSKPITATETGYGTIPNDPTSLDERAHMRYMSRLFFEQFMGGVTRSYSYELIDQNYGNASPFSDFGLVRSDLSPKPAYTALKSIIGSLTDAGAAFTTTPLTYQITGFTNNIHHLLLQKRDGSYVLALWLEVSDWNTANNAGGDVIVAPQAVSLTTAQTFSSANISVMSDAGTFSGSALPWSGQRGSFDVTDKITLVALKP